MRNVFNKEALFSTAIVTATITGVTAIALAVTDGTLLIAPFAGAALGFSYHMGVGRGMELGEATRRPSDTGSIEEAPSPK